MPMLLMECGYDEINNYVTAADGLSDAYTQSGWAMGLLQSGCISVGYVYYCATEPRQEGGHRRTQRSHAKTDISARRQRRRRRPKSKIVMKRLREGSRNIFGRILLSSARTYTERRHEQPFYRGGRFEALQTIVVLYARKFCPEMSSTENHNCFQCFETLPLIKWLDTNQ